MQHRALIVDDDASIRRIVRSVLDSLGHQYDEASSQESARKIIMKGLSTYVLLDLEIPEKDSRGLPRIQNGLNLLEEIANNPETLSLPVIVMTAHGSNNNHLAVECLTTGAANWINKPFPVTDRTLDKVIKQTLSKRPVRLPPPPSTSGKLKPFEGGVLSFLPSQVELEGHRVAGGDSVMRSILEELRVKNAAGKFTKHSTEELARKIRCDGGPNTITRSIYEFRKKVTQVMQDRAGVSCEEGDVIESVDGYRFKEWITISGVNDSTCALEKVEPPPNEAIQRKDAESRQKWILEQLERGVRLRVVDIVEAFKCSPRTAFRDTDSLRKKKLIKFHGERNDGHYVLCK